MRSKFEDFYCQRSLDVDQFIDDYFPSENDTPPFAGGGEEPQDYFELLSAYLDGEVTARERRQVQEWLDNDPEIKSVYSRLLRVHEMLKHAPPPPVTISPSELSDKVFAKIDQQRHRRLYCFGSALIAACAVAAISGLIFHNNSPIPRFAKGLGNSPAETQEGLMIALNYPVVDIPNKVSSSINEEDN